MNSTEALLTILLSPAQRLENADIDLLTKRFVDTAEGYQLDVLGRIVGQKRGGLADDVFRRYIRARIAANNSNGKREELINIANLVLNDASVVAVHEEQIATVRVTIDLPQTSTTEAVLVYFLTIAVGVGIRIIVETNTSPIANRFTYSSGSGNGYDNGLSPGIGGSYTDGRG